MDKLSIIGLSVALLAICFGFLIEGGSIAVLFELPAFIIVFGGTLGAVMLQSSMMQFTHATSLLKWVIYPPSYDISEGIKNIVIWAEKARESGYLALENLALDEQDSYTSKGLNLLVDGSVRLFKYMKENNQAYIRAISSGGLNTGEEIGGMTLEKDYWFYYLKEGRELFSPNNMLFKKEMSKYFSDCEVLVRKINAKEFKKKDAIKIVEFYSTNCGK